MKEDDAGWFSLTSLLSVSLGSAHAAGTAMMLSRSGGASPQNKVEQCS